MWETLSAKNPFPTIWKAEHRALDNETVYSYLEKLEKHTCCIAVPWYDLQGKEILKTQGEILSGRHLPSLQRPWLQCRHSVATSLENVVYLELCRRGYAV